MAELVEENDEADTGGASHIRECDRRLFAVAKEFGAWTRVAPHVTTVAAKTPGFEVYGRKGVVWFDRDEQLMLGLWSVLDYTLPVRIRQAEARCGFVKEGKQGRRNYVFGAIPEEKLATAIAFIGEEPEDEERRARDREGQ